MLRQLRIKGITWIDAVNLKPNEIEEVLESFDFHELDIEACTEPNQRARIDSYDNYIFLTLHFPKYNTIKKYMNLTNFIYFLEKNFLLLGGIFQANT